MVEKESMIEPQPSVPVDTKPNFSNKDIEQGRAWYHPTSLFWWAVQNWFLIGIGVVVVLAWRWPQVAKDGGIIRSEYSVRFSYWIIGSILMHKQIQYGGIALIFLITGLTLSTSALYKQSKQVYMHIYTQLFSFFFFSAVVFFIVNMVRLSGTTAIDPYTLVGLIVMSVMPTTVASNITMTRNAGGNTEAATMEVFVGNVLGIFITPLLLEMYTSSGPWEYGAPVAAGSVSSTAGLKIIYKDIAKQMGLAIFVPMFVGQVIQSVFPRQTKWVVDKLYLPKVSTFLLLLLIWTAFSTQFANGAFTSVPHAAIIFVVFLNLVLYLIFTVLCVLFARLTFLPNSTSKSGGKVPVSRRLVNGARFGKREATAISFCAAAKGLVVGTPILRILYGGFPPEQRAIISVPLVLYQGEQVVLAQLLVYFFQKWNARPDTRIPVEPADREKSLDVTA